MNIRKAVKLVSAAALIAAPVSVFAAPTVAAGTFGSSTLNGDGTVTTNSGLTCAGAGINEGGFTQEQCTNTAGDTLIHTVLLDPATGFTDESFVQMGASSGTSGIADKQTITESTGTEVFNSTAQLATGNFENVGDMASARIHLNQSVVDSAAVGFDTTFDFNERNGLVAVQGHDGTFTDMVIGNNVNDSTYTGGFKFENFNVEADSITTVGTNAASGVTYTDAAQASAALSGVRVDQSATLIDTAASVTQTFLINERHGAFTTGPGTANQAGPGTGTTWVANDSIINLEIGQLVGSGVTGSGASAMAFGLHDFANETTGAGTGVDSQVSATPASFYTPTYTTTGNTNPFGSF